ncbi:MAG: TIGR04282 family arsenosugar biosynthesis glycosyltransferase [Balneolales bacterium]
MESRNKCALIVFVKNPDRGYVKTRLAQTIGHQQALEVYLDLLRHTQKTTVEVAAHVHVYYSRCIETNDIWAEPHYTKHRQMGTHLGQRMHHAFSEMFDAGYKKAVIIGSDCFELTTSHITDAFEVLDRRQAVIGPAADGGYYLLGMRRHSPSLFKNKNWGSASVFSDTIRDMQKESLSWAELPVLNDIDTGADWEQYKQCR